VEILFVASVSVVAPDPVESRRLYVDALGLPLERLEGEYFASEHIGGSRHFGV
jgi:catechol 2,3-dioxygenase-like lactoylglutathione lyase family enzyme